MVSHNCYTSCIVCSEYYPGKDGDEVLYGTSDGKIGLVHLDKYVTENIYVCKVNDLHQNTSV